MSERAAKAACFATLNLELASNFSVGKSFKYFSFLYEKYHSLFRVDYPGLVTCPLEYHPRLSPCTALSSQQHCSPVERTPSSGTISYRRLLISGTTQSCQAAVTGLGSLQPTQPFPPPEQFFRLLVKNAHTWKTTPLVNRDD